MEIAVLFVLQNMWDGMLFPKNGEVAKIVEECDKERVADFCC